MKIGGRDSGVGLALRRCADELCLSHISEEAKVGTESARTMPSISLLYDLKKGMLRNIFYLGSLRC
jgi:hypothetical protein